MSYSVETIVKNIRFMPLENAALYTDSRRKLLLVAKRLSDENASKWPYLNPHQHCLRKIREMERANGELSDRVLLNFYETLASDYVNTSSRW